MDENFWMTCAVFCGIALVIASIGGSVILYEYVESDYDKCLDECHFQESSVKVNCIKECNVIMIESGVENEKKINK